MKYKWTFLNIIALIYIVGCILFTIINFSNLSEGEGWGVVSMVGLTGIGVAGLILDFIIQAIVYFVRRKKESDIK